MEDKDVSDIDEYKKFFLQVHKFNLLDQAVPQAYAALNNFWYTWLLYSIWENHFIYYILQFM